MSGVEFATPWAALLVLGAVLPLAALAAMAVRARAVRELLGLAAPGRSASLPVALGMLLLAGLLAVAVAQPVVAAPEATHVRADTEVFFVVDTSRSMLARAGRDAPTRIDRARVVARRLRATIPDVPVGLASLTDRLLPHAFPTADPAVFRSTIARSMGVGRPPPQELRRHATTYAPLEFVVRGNYFRPGLARRALVVLTDGEARETLTASDLRAALRPAQPLAILFIRVGGLREHVYRRDGKVELTYRPEPTAARSLVEFAQVLGAEVFVEDDVDGAAAALRSAVGEGPRVRGPEREQPRSLAPHAAAAAFLPLLFLLWRRNRA